MCHSAHPNVPMRRGVALVIVLVAAVLLQSGTAAAQHCPEPPALNDNVCRDIGNSIADYKECYRQLYDDNVIPAFDVIASCSHARADAAMQAALEGAAATVTGGIKQALDNLESTLAAPNETARCLPQLNDIADGLKRWMAEEEEAPDLDAYRRSHYGFEHLTKFTSAVLAARQNRALCGDALQRIRDTLVLLAALKAQHLDYCQVLRASVPYVNASRLQSLAQETAIDPDIHFDRYFNFSVTWNTQCGSFEFNGTGTTIQHTPCLQATAEYQYIVSELDNAVVGWLSDHRDAIVAVSTVAAATIAGLVGKGATAAGVYGAAAGFVAGVVISAVNYFMMKDDEAELEDLIADKQQELKDVIARRYISEAQFHALLAERCSAWRPVVDGRIQAMLAGLDAAKHVQAIDAYFALSNTLHAWYNALFLWATEPDAHGQRFIDALAEQELLAQRDAFDQEIFRARTHQEMAVQQNLLVNLKAQTSLLDCTDIPAPQRRSVQARLRGGLHVFNLACASLMQALAVRTEQPVPFTDSAAASDVSCAYTGFRSDVAALEIPRRGRIHRRHDAARCRGHRARRVQRREQRHPGHRVRGLWLRVRIGRAVRDQRGGAPDPGDIPAAARGQYLRLRRRRGGCAAAVHPGHRQPDALQGGGLHPPARHADRPTTPRRCLRHPGGLLGGMTMPRTLTSLVLAAAIAGGAALTAPATRAQGVKDVPAVDPQRYPDSIGYLYQGDLATVLWMQNLVPGASLAALERRLRRGMTHGLSGEIVASTMQPVEAVTTPQPTLPDLTRRAVQSVRLLAQYAFVARDYGQSLSDALGQYNGDVGRHQAIAAAAARVEAALGGIGAAHPGGPVPASPPPARPFGFWKMVIMLILCPSCLSSSRWLSAASRSLWQYQPRQGNGLFLRDGDRRPGFGHEAPYGQRRLIKQRHQDQGPTPAKDTHQPQAGGPPCPCGLRDQGRDVQDRAGRDRLVRLAADTEQPQRGDGDGQPQAGGALRLRHVGPLPLPAGALGDLKPLFDPGTQPIPTGGTGLGRQVSQDQPRVLIPWLPTGQQGTGQLPVAAFEGDPCALPRRARLGHQRLQRHPAYLARGPKRPARVDAQKRVPAQAGDAPKQPTGVQTTIG